jgi:hypothetical protein
MTQRVQIAERHLEAAISGTGLTATLEFTIDGYIVTFKKGSVPWTAPLVPFDVLEDDDSPELDALVDKARWELDR